MLRERRSAERRNAGFEDKLANAITGFTGSMRFVYIHLALYACWIAINLIPGLPHFDETFVMLAMIASVEAIFLSTFVLISQNRATEAANKRDDLDLHINLLAEHELTRLIDMVAAITQHLGIETKSDAELDEITKDIPPDAVLSTIERDAEAAKNEGS
jgi:uncharacterized membrane protein